MTNTKFQKSLTNPWIALIVLALMTLLIYSNIYHAPFVFDDAHQIEENTKITDLYNFFSIKQLFEIRPLVEFTFALNYKFGKLNVFGYHLVNVLIHMANGFIVYFLALNIFRLLSYPVKSSNFPDSYISLVALVSALIFVAHPIQTQAVTYTVQRYTSMAAFFYFLSVFSYIRGRCSVQGVEVNPGRAKGKEGKKRPTLTRRNFGSNANLTGKKNKQKTGEVERNRKSGQDISTLRFAYAGWFGFAFLSGVLAFLCKQNAATLPGVILLVEYMFFDRTWKGWKKKLTWFVPAFFLLALLILSVSGFFRGDFNFGTLLEDVSALSRETVKITRWNYLCTQFNVIVIYIRLLFLPFGQNLDPMYPFKEGFFDGLTPLAFLFISGIVAIGIGYIRKRPAIAFGIFWFFITLSVESSIIPISDALFEHRLYLPMFGFAIVMSYVLIVLLQNRKLWIGIISVAAIAYLGTATYLRNRVWKDPIILWRDVLRKAPENYRAHNNLGFALYHRGRVGEAIQQYTEGLRIKPDFALAINNLGIALLHQGKLDEAIDYLSKAVRISPRYVGACNNLGVAFATKGNLKEAIGYFSMALKMDPSLAETHNGLANALASQGKFEEAIKHWSKAIELRPDYAAAYYNSGIVLEKQGDFNKAEKYFSKAIMIKPDYAEAHSKLAVILARQGDLDGALDHFAKALKIRPGLAEARAGIRDVLTLKNKSFENKR